MWVTVCYPQTLVLEGPAPELVGHMARSREAHSIVNLLSREISRTPEIGLT